MNFESSGLVSSSVSSNWESNPERVLSCLIQHGGTTYDFTKAIVGTVKKTQKLANISLLDFSVAAVEVFSLPAPARGDYVTFTTAEYGQWFSGYISAEPTQTISGADSLGAKHWQYDIEVNSDEWLLNLQALPIELVYQNTTTGAILQDLAERLLPGVFNYDNIQPGPVVAKYVVDPTKVYSDVVSDLAGNAYYTFYSVGKSLFFMPVDQVAQNIIIDGDSKYFTPSALQIKPSTDKIVNDVTVVGMVEPQGTMTEYWVGDGITGKFTLTAGAYGVIEDTLLDETFSNSTIDSSVWTVYDSPIGYLQVSNGYLNCLGGYGDGSYGVSIISNDLFPLENNIRITHGQWDFVSQSKGLLGGIYFDLPTAPVNGVFPNLLFGVQASPDPYSGATILCPVVQGVPDPSQHISVTDYYNTRVTCRSILSFGNPIRTFHEYGYIEGDGTVGSSTSQMTPDTVTIDTFVAVININNGAILKKVYWSNTTTVTAEQIYAYYAPFVSDNLNATVTGITISRPLQANLDVKSLRYPTYTLYAPGGDINYGQDRAYMVGQTVQATDDWTITARIDSLTNLNTGGQRAGLMYRYRYDTQPNPVYSSGNDAMVCILISAAGVVSMRYRGGLGASVIEVGTLDQNMGQTDGITLPQYFQLSKVGTLFTGSYSSDGVAWTPLTTVNYTPIASSGPMLLGIVATGENISTVEQVTAVFQEVQVDGKPIVVDTRATLGTVSVPNWPVGYSTDTTNWTPEHIGVNELDTLDGLAPVATIVEQSNSVPKNSNLRGSFQYNPGQCQLDYFSDATTQTLNVPDIGDLVRLTYNRAGTSIARVVNQQSIIQESFAFGDSGHRRVTLINMTPQPRTSDECAAAGAATINSSGYQHFEGQYTQYNSYDMAGEPKAGAVLPFVNLSEDISGLSSEIIQKVESELLGATPQENYKHTITFGKIDFAKEYVNRLSIPRGAPMPNDIADIPREVNLDFFDASVLQPITSVELIAWDQNNWTFQVNDTLNIGEGIEVRQTDDSWGGDPGRNLIYRGPGPTFTTPRTINGRLAFIRRVDYRNLVPYSEDLTKWTATNVMVLNTKQVNPETDVSLISTVNAQQNGTISIPLTLPTQITTPVMTPRVVQTLSPPSINRLAPYSPLRSLVSLNPPVPQTYKTPTVQTVTNMSVQAMLNGPVGSEVQVDLLIDYPIGWGVDAWGTAPYGSPPTTVGVNPSTSVTLGDGWTTFEWDGLAVPSGATGASVQFTFLTASQVSITRVQAEPREGITVYCKTNGNTYGATSRYAHGVRANLPLIPPPPTGSVDFTDPLNPVITLTLPADETSVWGYELRDQDNKTVLLTSFYGQANFGAGYDMTYTYANNTSRTRTFYLYTFNLLGEYSPAYALDMVIPSPHIYNVTFDDETLGMSWTTDTATSYIVIVQIPGTTGPQPLAVAGQSSYTVTTLGVSSIKNRPPLTTANFNTTLPTVTLKESDYLNSRAITIIPEDSLGAGVAVLVNHIYAPPPVLEFDLNEIAVVAPPQNSITAAPVPLSATSVATEYIAESWKNHQINLGLVPTTAD